MLLLQKHYQTLRQLRRPLTFSVHPMGFLIFHKSPIVLDQSHQDFLAHPLLTWVLNIKRWIDSQYAVYRVLPKLDLPSLTIDDMLLIAIQVTIWVLLFS